MTIRLAFQELIEKKMDKEKRSISYREIADETGLSTRTIFLLYKGKSSQFKVIEALCRYLDCSPGDLLKLEELDAKK